MRALGGAFSSLDAVSLITVFERRAHVMRSVAMRSAIRVALQEIISGAESQSELRMTRGWKLFMLLPRMLLFRPFRGGMVPRKQLEARIRLFQDGQWLQLLAESSICAERVHQNNIRRRRRRDEEGEEGSPCFVFGESWGVICSKASVGRCSTRTWHFGHVSSSHGS